MDGAGKAQLPHGAFWNEMAQDRPAKLRSGLDWLAGGISFKLTAVHAGGCGYGFGCCAEHDLVGCGGPI